jgi:hypothetical protein
MNLQWRRRQNLLVNYLDYDEKTGLALGQSIYAECLSGIGYAMLTNGLACTVEEAPLEWSAGAAFALLHGVFVPCFLCLL